MTRFPELTWPLSRRQFVAVTLFSALWKSSAFAQDDSDLLSACTAALKTVSSVLLYYLWDEKGQSTPIDSADAEDVSKTLVHFVNDAASKSEFLLTKNFTTKPARSNDVDFVLPYADPNGVMFDALLRSRIASQPVPEIKTRTGKLTKEYAEPRPVIQFPSPAAGLQISTQYDSTDETTTGTTLPLDITNNRGVVEIVISTGFVRRVLESCVFGYPVIRGSRTLLWSTLKLVPGPQDSIRVESRNGPISISLLPLLCVTDSREYAVSTDKRQMAAVMGSLSRVTAALLTLQKGEKLPQDVDRRQLRSDIDLLSGVAQLFFLATDFIICHEVAHAVYLHQPPTDQKQAREQETIADEAATLNLFLTALTDTLDAGHTWTESFHYRQINSESFHQRLLWFERLFGFGVVTNIVLDLIGIDTSGLHPSNEERWQRNVRVWNNCVLAFSNISSSSK